MTVVGDKESNNTFLFVYITSNMNILGSAVTMLLTMTLNMHDGIPIDEACRRLEKARPGWMS